MTDLSEKPWDTLHKRRLSLFQVYSQGFKFLFFAWDHITIFLIHGQAYVPTYAPGDKKENDLLII